MPAIRFHAWKVHPMQQLLHIFGKTKLQPLQIASVYGTSYAPFIEHHQRNTRSMSVSKQTPEI
jgi:hypothetical protein